MKKLLLISLCSLFMGASLSFAQTIYYVKSDGTGDGSSWANAMGNLQSAVDSAEVHAIGTVDPAKVYVAEGTYFPSTLRKTSDVRSAIFIMKSNVEIYGGFSSSGDPAFADRDPDTYVSILSGDLGTIDDASDNAYQVVRNDYPDSDPLDSTAVLDGFTIEKGNPEGGSYIYGSAVCNYNASPEIRNCKFKSEGGQLLFFSDSHGIIRNCLFEDFTGERAVYIGSGNEDLYNAPVFKNCIFNNNTPTTSVFEINFYSNFFIDSCLFINNQSIVFKLNWYTNFIVENSTFENNFSADENGTIFNLWGTTESDYYIVRNCVFTNNSTDYSGGVMYATSSSPVEISNSLFVGNNSTDGDAGALYVYSTGLTVTNCTFYDNTVPEGEVGGAIVNANYFQGEVVINNSIFWGDSDDQVAVISDASTTVTNSLIKMADSQVFEGTNNLNENPYFNDPDNDDFSLKTYSSCVNTGNNSLYLNENFLDFDLAGNDRIYDNGVIDMGCYELQEEKSTQSAPSFTTTKKLNVFPNPASQYISIQTPNGSGISSADIYNISGRLIVHLDYPEKRINISYLHSGIYILKAKTDTGIYQSEFIKE